MPTGFPAHHLQPWLYAPLGPFPIYSVVLHTQFDEFCCILSFFSCFLPPAGDPKDPLECWDFVYDHCIPGFTNRNKIPKAIIYNEQSVSGFGSWLAGWMDGWCRWQAGRRAGRDAACMQLHLAPCH
jgi:hypothetical protein